MNKGIKIIVWIVIIAFIIYTLVHLQTKKQAAVTTPDQNTVSGNVVSYQCNNNKTITATFYEGQTLPPTGPGMPPTPGGSAHVVLSDGRTLDLKQTISADGVRYANPEESFVFWSKGNGALVLENNQEKSYIGCILVSKDRGGLTNVYHNGSEGFLLRYPSGYTVNEKYVYGGPTGKDIHGVSFQVPESQTKGTNLSTDTNISVVQVPAGNKTCSADLFISNPNGQKPKEITESGTTYSYATVSDAAAGNRYDESVYAIPGTNPCVAIRYLIHYANIQNYDPGTVKEFNEQELLSEFNKIRSTVVINQ